MGRGEKGKNRESVGLIRKLKEVIYHKDLLVRPNEKLGLTN